MNQPTQSLFVDDRPIHLTQVLKLSGLVLHGGEAKALIAAGRVRVNGVVELRKRRKMAVGDTVELEGGPTLTLVGSAVAPAPPPAHPPEGAP